MYLKEIVKDKRKHLSNYVMLPLGKRGQGPSLKSALKSNTLTIIGEIKRASPSQDMINENLNINETMKIYNNHMQGISVLTEETYFKGGPMDLISVRSLTKLPILRKDFILSMDQIKESYNIGADVILLIVAILSDEELGMFYQCAKDFGLEVIVEVHNEKELNRALKLKPEIVGINNRNLETFQIDLNQTQKLIHKIPKDICVISESGFHRSEDIKKIPKVHGILVGQAFMESEDIPALVKSFREAYHDKG